MSIADGNPKTLSDEELRVLMYKFFFQMQRLSFPLNHDFNGDVVMVTFLTSNGEQVIVTPAGSHTEMITATKPSVKTDPAAAEEGDFEEAAGLISKIVQADTNGDALIEILKYRFNIRERLLRSQSSVTPKLKLAPFEETYAKQNSQLVYPDETCLPLVNGRCIRFPAFPSDCSYVRVTVENKTVGYWSEEEWSEEPAEVMGAIMGAACGPPSE